MDINTLSMEQFYIEEAIAENYRKENKCCKTCRSYYEENGMEFCKKNDILAEENVCEQWN